ncbi:protein FAM171A2 [Megalops cyprinoides]|uniref:protein FAM171A2 n=1 Tax=Megalops cyprinoides TaxID=118141 RepID=UPI0018642D92|nr:protein FAM171A2 [Megalops cyprinoides]
MNGYLVGNGDVAVRMPPLHTSRFLLLFLFFGNVWKVLAKSISDQGTLEVLIRVQVFDNSDLSPLAGAAVEVFGNQTTLPPSTAGSDGVIMVTVPYRPGMWVIVTASKHGYVTNSAPWHASRKPLYASVSLYLLPQRPATLILYEDVVQVLLGSPGSRNQPWVQFQRKAVGPLLNSSYAELSAVLTAAKSQYEIGGFPYPLGQESNGTGGYGSWVELTAVAAVSAHLFSHNGTTIQVSDPVYLSVPLPSDTPVRTATSVPVWRFEAKTGLWVRNGTGYIKKEGTQMTWSFVASQLGYWVAAFPSATGMGLNPTGLRDITTYHTIFLLTILGSMALLVLILLCLLLYYCRRRCLKPRQQHRKMHISSTLDSSKRDQGTSTSHLNLISGGHIESGTSNADMDAVKSDPPISRDFQSSREDIFRHVPAHKLRHGKVNTDTYTRRGESFPMKVTRSTDTGNMDKGSDGRRHNANDNQGYSSDSPTPPPFGSHYQDRSQDGRPPEYSASQAADHMARPTTLNTQPGQLIFCSSMEQMKESMYHSMVPTLVIPAHYMRLSSDFSAMEKALEQQQQQQQDMEGIQVSLTLPRQRTPQQQQQQSHQQQQQAGHQGEDSEGGGWAPHPSSGPVRIPVLFDDTTMAQVNGELQALTEKKLLELGVKPHPRAWFVSLDGRSNSLVRHSYIELGNERGSTSETGGSIPRADVRESRPAHRKAKDERGSSERKGHAGKAYSKLPCLDDAEPGSSESRAAMCSPEDNSLTPLLDEGQEPRGATFPRRGRSRVNSSRSSNSETRRDSATSPEDENDLDDKDDEGENKKSPWQKREERPLMVFNVK